MSMEERLACLVDMLHPAYARGDHVEVEVLWTLIVEVSEEAQTR